MRLVERVKCCDETQIKETEKINIAVSAFTTSGSRIELNQIEILNLK